MVNPVWLPTHRSAEPRGVELKLGCSQELLKSLGSRLTIGNSRSRIAPLVHVRSCAVSRLEQSRCRYVEESGNEGNSYGIGKLGVDVVNVVGTGGE